MKRRIALSAGHCNVPGRDRGAMADGMIEGEEMVVFRDMVKSYLMAMGHKVSSEPYDYVTKDTVALFKKYFSAKDILIDFHIDAINKPDVSGCSCFVPVNASVFEKELAAELAYEISLILGIPNRGVKTELQSARKKLHWFTMNSETILVELFFISNKEDRRKYKLLKRSLALGVANIIDKYVRL